MRSVMLIWFAILAGSVLIASCASLVLYAWDKRRAANGGWRVPEKRLHLLSLLGGWPGAMLGQRWMRHKTVKRRFRIVFWLTVMGHLIAAGGITYSVYAMS